jgi:serine/threonine protein kinase/Tol biopolymer transport system component
MTLSAGTRLGPFEILAPIGAGGMGEVYRARDTRLGREVAVKVLSSEFSADADRRKRFEQEARSASALNHPNIITIHEIGSSDSTIYIAMEFVDGKTLRDVLLAGTVPTRRMLDLGYQMADGLAKAHAAGIVHRDLKPENVMISRDGAVKILDFGLAKLLKEQPDEVSNIPTAQATQAGMVLGTIGYMSPEQASGKPLDFRSDQFALGSIFYEMATGKRAFQRGTTAETLTAIIREEPEPVARSAASLPSPFRWIIERCLQKDPEERYASTRDLARDVRSVREHLSEAAASVSSESPAAAPGRSAARGRGSLLRWVGVAALVLAAFGVGMLAQRRVKTPPPSYQQISFGSGTIRAARFAPDGQTIVYAAAWDGGPPKLFLKHPSSPDSLPLELPSANLLSISPSGEMAIAVDCRSSHPGICAGKLARAALTGGSPRDVAEGIQDADWSRDGASLLVTRDVAGKARIEYPMGKVLYQTSGHISCTRLSPKGDRIAFLDHPFPLDDTGTVAVIDLSGNKKTLTNQWARENGLAWSADGDEIWFTATDAGANQSLYAVTLDGKIRVVTRVPGGLKLHDIARSGRVLIARESYRAGILGLPPGESREHDLSWLDYSFAADMSADGKALLFDEEGEAGGQNYTVYLRRFNGAPAVRLGDGSAIALSPDEKWALSSLPKPNSPLILLPTGTGEHREISLEGVSPEQAATWFPDSKRFVVAGSAPGHGPRLYVQDIDGGKPRAISPEGIRAGLPGIAVSPDGKWAAVLGPDRTATLYSAETGAARAVAGAGEDEFPVRFGSDGKSLYAWKRGELPVKVVRIDLETGRREVWKELMPLDPAGVERISNVVVAPEAHAYAYAFARVLSDLFVVEGLK